MPRVVWTRRARSDLRSIFDYIARDAPRTASTFTRRLMHSVRILRRSLLVGAVVPELFRADVREHVRGNYRVIYEVRSTQVAVLEVHHAARITEPNTLCDSDNLSNLRKNASSSTSAVEAVGCRLELV